MSYTAKFMDGPMKGEERPMGLSLPSDVCVMMEGGEAIWYHDEVGDMVSETSVGADLAFYELGTVIEETGAYWEVTLEPVVQRTRVTRDEEPAAEPEGGE